MAFYFAQHRNEPQHVLWHPAYFDVLYVRQLRLHYGLFGHIGPTIAISPSWRVLAPEEHRACYAHDQPVMIKIKWHGCAHGHQPLPMFSHTFAASCMCLLVM